MEINVKLEPIGTRYWVIKYFGDIISTPEQCLLLAPCPLH